ncbi:hypothetical protein DFH28DRAFT_423302 [Melampsora americana]|nr:hypothetical protein DFH28DRAFT_423302 [Melampsora americana]
MKKSSKEEESEIKIKKEEEEIPRNSIDSICYICHQTPSIYAPINCLHLTLCKSCAMKQATGGRCKVSKTIKIKIKIKKPFTFFFLLFFFVEIKFNKCLVSFWI